MPRLTAPARLTAAHRQRGVTTLIVVGVLFFVLAMVAAYTNRNLVFEQRTSGNQVRSTQATAAAEAGIEWALAMLNGPRIDDTCVPVADPARPSFRQQHLLVDDSTGAVRPTGTLTADGGGTLWAGCVFDGNDWRCACPDAGTAAPAAPAGAGVFPAFRVRFVELTPPQPGVVQMQVNGCTRLDDACLNFPSAAVGGEARATLSVLVALRGSVAAPPVAAVTVRRWLDVGGAPLGAFNNGAASGGLAIRAGGYVDTTNLRYSGPAGTPRSRSLVANDSMLSGLPNAERMFIHTFGTASATWRDQPASVRMDCTAAPCTADQLRQRIALNPGRPLWADGDLRLDTGGDIGSAAAPVAVVATGDVEIGTGVRLHGLLYGRAPTWNSDGDGEVQGALVAEGALVGSGAFSVVHDPDILTRLRRASGSFVRVPGAWRDF